MIGTKISAEDDFLCLIFYQIENFSTLGQKSLKILHEMLDKGGESWYIFNVVLALCGEKC